MENGPFIDDFPIEASIDKGFSMAMLNNQMVPSITCFASAWDATANCLLKDSTAELPTDTQWAEFGAGLAVPVPSNLLSKPSGRLK